MGVFTAMFFSGFHSVKAEIHFYSTCVPQFTACNLTLQPLEHFSNLKNISPFPWMIKVFHGTQDANIFFKSEAIQFL